MSFKTANEINLLPNDTLYSVAFKFPIASSLTLNDGTLPYGTTIIGVSVIGKYNGVDVPDLINGTPIISGADTIQVTLDYPTTTMSGIVRITNMGLQFIITLNTTATIQQNFNNVIVNP